MHDFAPVYMASNCHEPVLSNAEVLTRISVKKGQIFRVNSRKFDATSSLKQVMTTSLNEQRKKNAK